MIDLKTLIVELMILPGGQGLMLSAFFYIVIAIFSMLYRIDHNRKSLLIILKDKHLAYLISLLPISILIAGGLLKINISENVMALLGMMAFLMTPFSLINVVIWLIKSDGNNISVNKYQVNSTADCIQAINASSDYLRQKERVKEEAIAEEKRRHDERKRRDDELREDAEFAYRYDSGNCR